MQIIKRNWTQYSKNELGIVDWDIGSSDVQQFWNVFENLLVNIVDKVAPLSTFINYKIIQKDITKSIKTLSTKDIAYLKTLKETPQANWSQKLGNLTC